KMKDFENALLVSKSGELKNFNERDRVLFLNAEILYGLERYDESIDSFNEILKKYPDSKLSDDSLYNIAYAYKESGKYESAAEFFLVYFKDGMDLGKRQKALYNVILMNMKLSQTQSAIQYSQLFLDSFEDGDLREKVLFRLGSLFSDLKNYNKAVEAYRIFVDKYSSSERLDEAYFLLGYNLQLADKNAEALSAYEKVGKKDYKGLYLSALKNRAIICFALNKEDDAALIYRQIINEMPDCDLEIGAYIWLAKYYSNNKRYNDALVILNAVETREDASAHIAEIGYFKGEVYRYTKQYELAVESYNLVVSNAEKQVYAGASHIGKGLCLIELAKLDEAKVEFETAILENADDNTIAMRSRFELANITFKKGEFEEAAKLYMLVAILYDDKDYGPRSLFRAGESFRSDGRLSEAEKAFKELVVRFKKHELVKEANLALADIENKKV
ncbi:MAG: tetratricopeptide repeat protein, partial [Candidatus Omnitrophota bacterium]